MPYHPSRSLPSAPTQAPWIRKQIVLFGLIAILAFASSTATAASCITPPAMPYAWWKLDTINFGWTPELMARNDATISNNPFVVPGFVGQAIAFDANDYLAAADCQHLDIGTGDFTIATWVRPANVIGDDGTIVSKTEFQNSKTVGYHLEINAGKLLLQIGDPASGHLNFRANQLPDLDDGLWHLVVASVDRDSPTGARLSVDNYTPQYFNPTSRPGSLSTNAVLRMGRAGDGSWFPRFLFGDLDEVQIYKHALSPTDVLAIYGAGPSGLCTRGLPKRPRCDSGGME